MQVILDSSFARPGSAPIWGGKKGEFRDWTRQRTELAVLLCVLRGGGGGRGGGVGITPLYGLSEVWAAPKGMAFGLFTCEKGVNFIHIGLIKGVFFTLAWHWVLNTY